MTKHIEHPVVLALQAIRRDSNTVAVPRQVYNELINLAYAAEEFAFRWAVKTVSDGSGEIGQLARARHDDALLKKAGARVVRAHNDLRNASRPLAAKFEDDDAWQVK